MFKFIICKVYNSIILLLYFAIQKYPVIKIKYLLSLLDLKKIVKVLKRYVYNVRSSFTITCGILKHKHLLLYNSLFDFIKYYKLIGYSFKLLSEVSLKAK